MVDQHPLLAHPLLLYFACFKSGIVLAPPLSTFLSFCLAFLDLGTMPTILHPNLHSGSSYQDVETSGNEGKRDPSPTLGMTDQEAHGQKGKTTIRHVGAGRNRGNDGASCAVILTPVYVGVREQLFEVDRSPTHFLCSFSRLLFPRQPPMFRLPQSLRNIGSCLSEQPKQRPSGERSSHAYWRTVQPRSRLYHPNEQRG
jgi:hypothetical protein